MTELYAVMADAEIATRNYVIPLDAPVPPEGKSLQDAAVEFLRALMRSADANRIWFSSETCNKIDGMVSKLRSAYNLTAISGFVTQRARMKEPTKCCLMHGNPCMKKSLS